jgi:hypothetical protein
MTSEEGLVHAKDDIVSEENNGPVDKPELWMLRPVVIL